MTALMTREMSDLELLGIITARCRAVVLRSYRRDSCIATTRVIVDVASQYGFSIRPQPVKVGAFNREGAALFKLGVPPGLWPDTAHSVGITGGASRPGYWNGHLVAMTDGYLIDGSLDQMSRPLKGLELTPLVTPRPEGAWTTDASIWIENSETLLLYGLLDDDGYITSPNWSRSNSHIRQTTSLAIKEVRRAYQGH